MLRVGHRVMMIRALGGCLAGGVVAGGVVLGMNASHHDQNSALSLSGNGAAAQAAAQGQISCPDVASKLPAIPAQAQAEVTRNLALLDTQIAEANKRLVTSVGQGGPNFVQNAILGPLKDKRVSTIDRIAISIGRRAQKPTGLDSLAACSLNGAAGGGGAATGPATAPPANAGAGAGAAGGAAGPGTISCPDVASKLPAIPAQAQAEVTRNLTLLNTQIAEANKRLVDTVGQGGPNFVQNAILGPLKSKRIATIDRIAISIGRRAQKPTGLDSLADCTLNKGAANGGAAAGGAAGGGAKGGNKGGNKAGNQGGNAGANARAGRIVCPDVASRLPAIPARAQAEVTRNLTLLNTQIAEANKRLVDTVGQGGPNFVQNAILGPLKDKRVSTIDRIAISIGRQGTKPQGLDALAPCRLQ